VEDQRVMVVTGAGGKAFCSGADLKAVEELMQRPGALDNAPLGFSNLEPDKPRIAAIEGYCIGGGIELACWCDFAVAGESAQFAALNRRSGVPWVDGGTQRMASYPQKSLLADRAAALATHGMSLEEGLAMEARLGHPTASESEFTEGVKRFAERKERGEGGTAGARHP
jgi:enoyl-CoA hydratase/carnithine racemase